MSFEQIRDRLTVEARRSAPEHQARLRWSADQLADARQQGLRSLLATAQRRSPWHRARLRDIDAAACTLQDLPALPTMSKADVMDGWDELVGVPGVTLGGIEAFLERQRDFAYVDESGLQAFTSGGSSGRRGVYVWDAAFFAAMVNVAFRYQDRDTARSGERGRPRLRAVLTVGKPPHASTPLFGTALDPMERVEVFSVLLPFDELVRRIQAAQPDHLIGYPSVIARLAEAQVAGRLHIEPRRVSTNSEPLLPEARAMMTGAWGAVVNNMWGSTEIGMHAIACDQSPGLHLAEDVVVLERVDEEHRPVADDAPAAKLLLTSLANTAFPFLRYELDDQVQFLEAPCPCGSPHRLIGDVTGRSDDDFAYPGGIAVPAVAFRDVLGPLATVEEYQVHQRPDGAAVTYVGRIDNPEGVRAELRAVLSRYGLRSPHVTVEPVDQLQRQAQTGKLRRFVPLVR